MAEILADGVISLDDRPAELAINRANAGLDGHEKKTKTVLDRAGREWQVLGENVIRINDKSKSSVDRLISSLEKQSQVYGKSGVEKLIAQRDQMISRYSKEQSAVESITKSYAKMIEEQKKLDKSSMEGPHGNTGNLSKLGLAAKDLYEGRGNFAAVEVGKYLGSLGSLAVVIGGVVGAFGALIAIGSESEKALGQYGLSVEEFTAKTGIASGKFEQFEYAAKASGKDIQVFDHLMRGLTQSVSDNSNAGEKARLSLARLGTSVRDANGNLRSTEELLTSISIGFKALPEGIERDRVALDLFKRAGIENVGVLTNLAENLQHAKDVGFGGPTDQELAKFKAYQTQVTEFALNWEDLKRTLTKPLAAVVNVLFRSIKGPGAELDSLFDEVDRKQNENSTETERKRKETIAKDSQDAIGGARAYLKSFGVIAGVVGPETRAADKLGMHLRGADPLADSQIKLNRYKEAYDKALMEERQQVESGKVNPDVMKRIERDTDSARVLFRAQEANNRELQKQHSQAMAAGDTEKTLRDQLLEKQAQELMGEQKINAEYDRRVLKLRQNIQATPANLKLESKIRNEDLNKYRRDVERAGEENDRNLSDATLQAEKQRAKGTLEREAKLIQQSLTFQGNDAGGIQAAFDQRTKTARQEFGFGVKQAATDLKAAQEFQKRGDTIGFEKRVRTVEIEELKAAGVLKENLDNAELERRIAIANLRQKETRESETADLAAISREREIADLQFSFTRAQSDRISRLAIASVDKPKDKLYAEIYADQRRLQDDRAQVAVDANRIQSDIQRAEDLKRKDPSRTAELNEHIEGLRLIGVKEIARLELDTLKTREDSELKIIEYRKRQFDSVKKEAETLLDTLFNRPSDFGKHLLGVLKQATLRPIVDGLSDIVAKRVTPLVFGKDGNSGVNGALESLFGKQAKGIPIISSAAGPAVPVVIVNASGGAFGSGGQQQPFSFRDFLSNPGAAGRRAMESVTSSVSFPTAAGGVMAAGGLLAGLSGGGSSIPAGSTSTAIDFGGGSIPLGGSVQGGGFNLSSLLGAPGGTSGFAGPVEGYGGEGGGFNLGSILGLGKGKGGLLSAIRHPQGLMAGLKEAFYNSEAITTGAGKATTAAGIGGLKGNLAGIFTSKGAASLEIAAGLPLAMAGLFGRNQGTGKGILQSTSGGALIGAGIGTMILPGIGTGIGAGIGAAAGLAAGVVEKVFGIESQTNEAKRLVKEQYGVNIDSQMARQIVELAKSKYSNHVSIAVRDPEVRKMLELYSAGTGQRMPASQTSPRAGSLVQQGGSLMQEQQYRYGQGYTLASNLGTAGAVPTSVSISIAGQGAGQFLAGNVVSPEFVQARFSQSQQNSNGRMQNSALFSTPGLVVA